MQKKSVERLMLGANRNQALDLIKCCRANPWHIHKNLNVLEQPVLLTIGYDALHHDYADARKKIQLLKGCNVGIDQAKG